MCIWLNFTTYWYLCSYEYLVNNLFKLYLLKKKKKNLNFFPTSVKLTSTYIIDVIISASLFVTRLKWFCLLKSDRRWNLRFPLRRFFFMTYRLWYINVVVFLDTLQTERSFQKQPTIFLNRKKGLGVKKKKAPLRYTRNVGLGFKTPREVME